MIDLNTNSLLISLSRSLHAFEVDLFRLNSCAVLNCIAQDRAYLQQCREIKAMWLRDLHYCQGSCMLKDPIFITAYKQCPEEEMESKTYQKVMNGITVDA